MHRVPPAASRRIARSGRVSPEIRDIHAGALCEKYGNNIAEAKQNITLHMKYAGSFLQLRPPLPLFLIHLVALHPRPRHAVARFARPRARARVYSFSLFKAPHLPRS